MRPDRRQHQHEHGDAQLRPRGDEPLGAALVAVAGDQSLHEAPGFGEY